MVCARGRSEVVSRALCWALYWAGCAILLLLASGAANAAHNTQSHNGGFAQAVSSVQVHALITGHIDTRAAFAYQGGAFSDKRRFVIGCVLVRHPQGDVLIDAGFGHDVDAHAQTLPAVARWVMPHKLAQPAAAQLRAAGIAPQRLKAVILTHAHWDHVSGLADLRGVPVWAPQAELDFIATGHRNVALAQALGTEDYKAYEFNSGPYEGFAASHDFFGDGSVVLVPAPGHTPGSVVVFVSPPEGPRYAFIGDIAWQQEGVDGPAQRPWVSRAGADSDAAGVKKWLEVLNALQQSHPKLVIVPAHDERAWARVPALKGMRD
jgi:N-acyl homoserine lactone hydrolase